MWRFNPEWFQGGGQSQDKHLLRRFSQEWNLRDRNVE